MKDINGSPVTVTTDENGSAVSPKIDVTNPDGTRVVYLKEVSLGEHQSTHDMSPSIITVSLDSNSTEDVGEIVNQLKSARLSLSKTDDTGNKLPGVQFTVYLDADCTDILKDKDSADVVLTTNAEGKAVSSEIEIPDSSGAFTVYVKETLLPQPAHKPSGTVYTAELVPGETTAVNQGRPIVNEWQKARFELLKENIGGDKLAGVQFTAYSDENCTQVIKNSEGHDVVVTTDENGRAVSGPITVTETDGTRAVYIKETALPDNMAGIYNIEETVYSVTLNAGSTAKVNGGDPVINYKLSGKISLHKTDNLGNDMEGVEFTAFNDRACTEPVNDVDGNPVVLVTDSEGYAQSAHISF